MSTNKAFPALELFMNIRLIPLLFQLLEEDLDQVMLRLIEVLIFVLLVPTVVHNELDPALRQKVVLTHKNTFETDRDHIIHSYQLYGKAVEASPSWSHLQFIQK